MYKSELFGPFSHKVFIRPPLSESLTLSQILDHSKLKHLADDNFKFDENGRHLSKWVKNTVGKG